MSPAGRAVLVVDDDRTNRVMMSKLLEHEGYQTTLAEDGNQALAAVAEQRFDAVLLDIVMPGIDGIEVLRRIKGDAATWRTPVIMISSIDEVDSIATCLELGADDYVQKPFDPVILRARLGACLARHAFHVLEAEYQKVVEQQAAEIEDLRDEVDRLRDAQSGAGSPTA